MVEAIEQAWHAHLLVLFRGQRLADEQLVAFARRFGELHKASGYEYGGKPKDLPPEVELISNVIRNGRPIGALGAAEATWHTDMSMFEIPAAATLLYAEEIPPEGGNTRFANLYLAYEALDAPMRARVEGRTSIHDAAYLASGGVRAGYEAVTEKSKGPGAQHPIVRTHPETGRRALYLGRQGYGYILDLPEQESDAMLDTLWRHMTQPAFVWEHQWRVGDVLMWDNRCTAHARNSFDPNARRILHRVTVMGERPR